jgi:hypothetical protein
VIRLSVGGAEVARLYWIIFIEDRARKGLLAARSTVCGWHTLFDIAGQLNLARIWASGATSKGWDCGRMTYDKVAASRIARALINRLACQEPVAGRNGLVVGSGGFYAVRASSAD